MARININDIDKYASEQSYFSLKNDRDVARVRFVMNTIDDLEVFVIHPIPDENGRMKYYNCKRDYNSPITDCPMCEKHQPTQIKLFVPIYDTDTGRVMLWERGKRFISEMSSLCARYASDKPLVSQVFDIERRGAKGDTNTTYGIYPVGNSDDTRLEDLPTAPIVLGKVVVDGVPEQSREVERPTRRTPSNSDRF